MRSETHDIDRVNTDLSPAPVRPATYSVARKVKQAEAKEERRARALERAHGEIADRTTRLLETISQRDKHIEQVKEAERLANEEKVLKAALHKADKEASILKTARATEYARLLQLSSVMADEERLKIEADAKEVLWVARQQNQRRLIISRDNMHATMEKA